MNREAYITALTDVLGYFRLDTNGSLVDTSGTQGNMTLSGATSEVGGLVKPSAPLGSYLQRSVWTAGISSYIVLASPINLGKGFAIHHVFRQHDLRADRSTKQSFLLYASDTTTSPIQTVEIVNGAVLLNDGNRIVTSGTQPVLWGSVHMLSIIGNDIDDRINIYVDSVLVSSFISGEDFIISCLGGDKAVGSISNYADQSVDHSLLLIQSSYQSPSEVRSTYRALMLDNSEANNESTEYLSFTKGAQSFLPFDEASGVIDTGNVEFISAKTIAEVGITRQASSVKTSRESGDLSYSFDGSTSYIHRSGGTLPDIKTICGFFKIGAINGSLFQIGCNTDYMTLGGGGAGFPTVKSSINSSAENALIGTNLTDTISPHSFAITQDGADLKLYIDGVLDATELAYTAMESFNTYSLDILGADADASVACIVDEIGGNSDFDLGEMAMLASPVDAVWAAAYHTAGIDALSEQMYDSFDSTDSSITTIVKLVDIIDSLLFEDSTLGGPITTNLAIIENILFTDIALIPLIEEISDSLAMGDSAIYNLEVIRKIIDIINHQDTVSTNISAIEMITSVFVLGDLLSKYISGDITDSVNFSEQLETIYEIHWKFIDSLLFSDDINVENHITLLLSDDLQIDDNLESNAIVKALLSDGFNFTSVIDFEGEQYLAYIVNTKTKGISEYTNFNFNSMSGNLAANDTGIYSLTGDDDNGLNIDASITTAIFDFGSSYAKQNPYAYIGIANNGSIILKTITVQNGIKKTRLYEATATKSSIDTTRIQMGRGVRSKYWQFTLANKEGGNFELDSIEFTPLVLNRRVTT